MKEATLLALPQGMEIDQIHITQTGLVVSVKSTTPSSCCPLCSEPSPHIHSYYHRTDDQMLPVLDIRLSFGFACANSLAATRTALGKCLPNALQTWPSHGHG